MGSRHLESTADDRGPELPREAPGSSLDPLPSTIRDHPADEPSAIASTWPHSDETVGPAPLDEARLICPNCRGRLGRSLEDSENLVCTECGTTIRIESPTAVPVAVDSQSPGRFRLIHRVGEGSFGVVWRAFDNQLKRPVALKVPHPSFLSSPNFQERFWREAQADAVVRHHGIVPVYEVIATPKLTAIVSHFVEGVTLKELLEIRKLRFDESARLVAEVAEALQHAHDRGLVHRDIKPGNLMIELPGLAVTRPFTPSTITALQDGRMGRPLIVDFGLALRDHAEIVLTTDGQIIGTPAYMSPEQAEGRAHHADGRSDVYSLGVVLYELLCGELPFRGSWSSILQQVVREEPRPPRKINDRIPRDLETICLKAMAKEPGWRYATAGDLSEDLRRYLDRRPIRAREFSKAEIAYRWARRNPVVAALSGVSALAAIAFLTLLILFAVHEARSVARLSRLSAGLALDNGLVQCERGDVPTGLLWLSRALQLAPADAADLQPVIRRNLNAWFAQTPNLQSIQAGVRDVEEARLAAGGPRLLTIDGGRHARLTTLSTSKPSETVVDLGQEALCLGMNENGTVFVTGHGDGTASARDARTGAALGSPMAHPKGVYSISVSQDGTTLATACYDKQVRIWSLPACVSACKPFSVDQPVELVALSPRGDLVAAVCKDLTVHVFEVATGHRRAQFRCPSVMQAICFDPAGERLAAAGLDRMARIWESSSGRPVGSPMAHDEEVKGLAFSHDGKLLVTASLDRVRLWDATTAEPEGPALHHGFVVLECGFSPDDRELFSVSSDGAVRRWSLVQRAVTTQLDHGGDITAIAVSHDGRHLITASGAGAKQYEARIWDLQTRRPIGLPIPLSNSSFDCGFARNDRLAMVASQDAVRLIETKTGIVRHEFREEKLINAVLQDEASGQICTGTLDGKVRLYSFDQDVPVRTLELDSCISILRASPGFEMITIGTDDGQVVTWNLTTGDHTIRHPHRESVVAIDYIGSEGDLVTASWDRTCCIHRADQVKAGRDIYLRHDNQIVCLRVSPDQKTIVTGCADHSIRLWDAATGAPTGALLGHHGRVTSIEFAKAGKVLASSSWDNTTRLWDLATRRPIGPPIRHGASVQVLAIDPGGNSCISGSFDHTARIFRIPDELPGDPARLALWAQIATGTELDSSDSAHVLDPAAWEGRRRELERSGGPAWGQSLPDGQAARTEIRPRAQP